MTKQERGLSGEGSRAEEKLSEIQTVVTSARRLLAELVSEVDANRDGAKDLLVPLTNLQKLFAAFVKAEEDLDEKYGHILRTGDIDFDVARADIGSRLDRIRNTRGTTGIPGEPDA